MMEMPISRNTDQWMDNSMCERCRSHSNDSQNKDVFWQANYRQLTLRWQTYYSGLLLRQPRLLARRRQHQATTPTSAHSSKTHSPNVPTRAGTCRHMCRHLQVPTRADIRHTNHMDFFICKLILIIWTFLFANWDVLACVSP